MRQPFVCSPCRLNLALGTHCPKTAAKLQKRLFSLTPATGQEYQQHPLTPTRPSHGSGSRQQPAHIRRGGAEDSGHGRSEALRGRYSGALRPQQLLQELDTYEPPAYRRRPVYGDDLPRALREDAPSIRYMPSKRRRDTNAAQAERRRQVSEAYKPFTSSLDERYLHGAWQALLDMSSESSLGDLRRLGDDKDGFRSIEKKMVQFMRRLDTAWVRSLQAKSSSEASEEQQSPANALADLYLGREKESTLERTTTVSLPSPWEFSQVAKKLGWLTPSMRVEMIWRLAKGLTASKMRTSYALSTEKSDQILEQIVLLWHDTLKTHLKQNVQAAGTETNPDSLDWSFLPLPETFIDERRHSQTSLQEALSMLVPVSGPENSKGTVAEYQSALLLTLDMIRSQSNSSRSPPDGSDDLTACKAGYAPLVSFLSGIFKRVAKTSVPPGILNKLQLGEDPTLAYYEDMVRRFDLKEIPPIRTERGRPSQPSFSEGGMDELGRPLRQQTTPAPQQDKVGTSTAARESATESATDDPSGDLSPDLSKEGLLESGFTVQDVWDMDPDVHRKVDTWIKRLGRSIQATNLSIAEACWKEVGDFNAAQTNSASVPLYLYEHFMLAFLALRQPKLAVEAWNAVIQAGLEPTVRTWTVMMRGCARAKDADTMEAFWRRMRDQGVQPDQHAWSVRIMCLIKARRIKEGLNVLHHMGQEWVAAVKAQHTRTTSKERGKQKAPTSALPIDYAQYTTDINGIPRPDLVIMNSAISALAGASDADIPQVLAWGRSFNIKPDLTTYNALLNVSMRHSQTPEALAILKRMQTENIQPDSTTFTVLLTALFQSNFFHDLDPEAQTSKLFDLIASIEASGPTAQLDTKGYALAIDRMLKQHSNPAAARALLEHMSSRGLEPTAHIYTILMASYFDASPPDFDAVEALWTRIQRTNAGYGAALDTIFYDRMVENYAHHHSHVGIQPALKFLDRMSKEGKRPGWRALELVARALAQRGEWARLSKIVHDLREGEGTLRLGARGVMGQNEFWRFVLGTGILDGEGPLDEQSLRRNVGTSSFHGLSRRRT